VLSNEHVDALVVSMTGASQIDEYVGASGGATPTTSELDLLEDYMLSGDDAYCERGCDACHGSCPAGVEASEVLRTRMYAVDYGDFDYARQDYARLGAGAAACVSCTAMPCMGSCPRGLPVGDLTASTHRLLG